MARDVSSRRLIAAGTRLSPVPLVPEIRLHQASDPISLWQRTEEDSGRTGLDPPFWAFAWAAGQALARGATVLAADFGRAYLPRDRLTPLAAYDVPGQRVTEDADTKHTTVWTLAERPA